MKEPPSRLLEAVIIGGGPYGLSIASHFGRLGIPHRIFGRAMDSWLSHMPKGMLLKSDGFASNIFDPGGEFTLKQYCLEREVQYADLGAPVRLETFAAYGLAFQYRHVPQLENQLVVSVDLSQDGFLVRLETGEIVTTKRVIFAVGITHFSYIPENLRHLPPEFVSHSFQHSNLESYRGRSVAVIGGGASSIDIAGLLFELGADVQLITRAKGLVFHEKMSMEIPRSLWQMVRSPLSCLGPGLKSRLFADAPGFFHHLPEHLRLRTVQTFLGPAGGWFAKEKIVGKVPVLHEFTPEHAQIMDNRVCLHLRSDAGTERTIRPEHIIAATGYRVDLKRLKLLNPILRDRIRTVEGSPILSSAFESSVAGLYFVGLAAANSFGPVMRFSCGAGYTARRLSREVG